MLFTGLAQKVLGSDVDVVRSILPDFEVHLIRLSVEKLTTMGSLEHPTGEDMGAFLARLRAEKPWLGFIGSSGGGFGAIRHGMECGVDIVVGLSPFTTFDEDAAEWDWRVWKLRRVLFAGEPDNAKRNVRHFLDRSSANIPIHVFYPEKNAYDRQQAQNLGSYPNVKLHPQVGMQSHVMHGEEVKPGADVTGFWQEMTTLLRGSVEASAARHLMQPTRPIVTSGGAATPQPAATSEA